MRHRFVRDGMNQKIVTVRRPTHLNPANEWGTRPLPSTDIT